ncbi:MAG: response regulator transcription factor [Betaproteobacteria bacterium]|nr:response regulator transcription factor [Betaproteobacteria bacterium]
MIRLLIVDDHTIVRHGLRQVVSESADIEVAAEAGSSAEAVRLLRENTYDLVLLDISLPDKNGIETLKQIKRDRPGLPVIMLSMHAEDEFGVRALKAGASGYVNKQSAHHQLVAAIRQVASGRRYISPELAEELARSIGEATEKRPHELLSDREFDTLRMLAGGKSLTEIAESLSISPKTVSVYRTRLLEKMKLKNNAEIAHYAVKNGLID